MTLFLGIDVGTSSVRAALVDGNTGKLLAIAGQEYPLHQPQPGYAEQDPDDWWQATIATVQQAVAQAGRNDVAAISYSGHMHGTVLLNAAHQPLHPAIIWADQRSGKSTQLLIDAASEEHLLTTTGTLPAAGFMGATLVWLRDHQPKLLDKTEKVILTKDYVRLCMTGEIATEVTDAAGTGLLNIHTGDWAQTVIKPAQLPLSIFPKVLESYDLAGELTAQAAEALGLKAGIPVVAGAADQPAQAIGNGIFGHGIASITIGSGGQIFVPMDPIRTDSRVHVFNHAAPGWYALGATLSAGLSLRWLRDLFQIDYEAQSALAQQAPAGADGLVFLPHLNGERTPHMDPCGRGSFIGLSSRHGREHMIRAVMEGVSFTLRQALEICESLTGQADVLVASGGGVESTVWRQIVTDIIGRPLRKSLQTEQSALGAAMLAGVGIKHYATDGSPMDNFMRLRDMVAHYDDPTPYNERDHKFYTQRYEHYKTLYPLLKADLNRLAGC